MNSPGNKQSRAWFLDWVERVGNKLPDPAILFLVVLLLTWVASAILAPIQFGETDPRTIVRDASGQVVSSSPIRVTNQLSGPALVNFLAKMVKTFVEFPPLGVVLVAILGVGVAEHTGFINACLKGMLKVTPKALLTPMLLLVAIVSHSAADVGYVLVIPLGGIIFAAAGRHPLAGIAVAFAGVSGGYSANFLPSSLDPLLQGFTQSAAQVIDPKRTVNPLCNWYFTAASCLVIVGAGWFITDRVVEPRLRRILKVDAAPSDLPTMDALQTREQKALWVGLFVLLLCLAALYLTTAPPKSPFRSPAGALTAHGAPLMESIVPLIFLIFLLPGIAYGYVAGTVKNHRDVVQGMSKSMSTMAYYLVMAFFAAQFTFVFRESNVGALLALKGGGLLKSLALPPQITILGVILMTTTVNLNWLSLGEMGSARPDLCSDADAGRAVTRTHASCVSDW